MLISRLNVLCTEIYKRINGINLEYMKEIFAKSQIRSSLRFPLKVYGFLLRKSGKAAEFKRNVKLWDGQTCSVIFPNIILPNEI